MTQWAFPFLSVNNDRTYSDSDFSLFYKNLFKNGVAITIAKALKVKEAPNKGMRIIVSSGVAVVEGRQYFNTEDLAIDVPVASTTQDRKDCVVVRLDLNNRVMSAVYKQGTTDLERTEQVYELKLAEILVVRNASEVTNANIKDFRADDNACGYTSPYEKINVSGLEEQYTSMLEAMFANVNQYVSDEKVKFESDMKNVIALGNDYINQAQIDWQTFLETISTAMNEDIALNLQNQIMNLTADQLVFSKNDLPFEYPEIEVLALTNGFGVTALGEENWLGDVPETIPTKIGYPSKNAVTVKVPNNWKMSLPKVTEIKPDTFLLVEGNKSLQIKIKENR